MAEQRAAVPRGSDVAGNDVALLPCCTCPSVGCACERGRGSAVRVVLPGACLEEASLRSPCDQVGIDADATAFALRPLHLADWREVGQGGILRQKREGLGVVATQPGLLLPVAGPRCAHTSLSLMPVYDISRMPSLDRRLSVPALLLRAFSRGLRLGGQGLARA